MAHAASPTPFYSVLGKATWSADYVNRLPDSAFLLLEPGGKKDDTGRIAPRSLRHLPVFDADGNLDLAHLQNAIAQVPKAGPWLTPAARKGLLDKANVLLAGAKSGTHKSAAGVPSWAIGYVRYLDLHEALSISREFAHAAWGGDALLAKRLSKWVKTYKAAGKSAGAPKKVATATEAVLRAKVAAHNRTREAPAAKAKLSVIKDVWSRGVVAFANAGRPSMLSKAQWGMERVNAFLHLLGHIGPRVAAYTGDNDLLAQEHPASPAFKGVKPTGDAVEKEEISDADLEASGGKLAPEVGIPKKKLAKQSFQGIPIDIDRPIGFVQEGDGWTRTYTFDYGYIPSTLGGDGDELDIFLGPDENSTTAYWFKQLTADGRFDEYKLMLGFASEDAARECYLAHIPERFLGEVTSTSVGMVRALLGLHPSEAMQTIQGPRTYFCTNARGELVLGHCSQLVYSDPSLTPSATPITLSADQYEAMSKALRAVAGVLPEGKALRSSTMGAGWREEVTKGTDADVFLISPTEPLAVDLTDASSFFAELKIPFLFEYPDTPAARAVFGDSHGAFVLDSAPDRIFVANYELQNQPGMTMLKAATEDDPNRIHSRGAGAPTAPEAPAAPTAPEAPAASAAPAAPVAPEAPGKGKGKTTSAKPASTPANSPAPKPAKLESTSGEQDPETGTLKKSLDTFTEIHKADEGEERYVLGPVLIPNRVDLQHDTYSEEEVRNTAHDWMANYQNMGHQHAVTPDLITGFRMNLDGLTNGKIVPLESALLRVDESFPSPAGPRFFPKGTWMLAARFVDDELWEMVKSGKITGWSIGGFATRNPVPVI